MEENKIDRKLLYLLPSILALALSLTCFVFVFGSILFDLQNTRYAIYISVPQGWNEERCLNQINSTLSAEELTGFTVLKNTEGGKLDENGRLVLDNSYQIVLLKVPQAKAEQTARSLKKAFAGSDVMVEKSIVKVSFLE